MEKSIIKERMLIFSDLQGIPKSNIAKNIDIAPSNFMGKSLFSGLNSESLVKFLTIYKQVSAEWLMRGEGPMLRSDGAHTAPSVQVGGSISGNSNSPILSHINPLADPQPILSAKDEVIASLERTIAAKDDLIAALRTNISLLQQDH